MWDNNKTKWDSTKLQWDTGGDPPEVWTSHFDNTEWVETGPGMGFGFWNGTQWEAQLSANWTVVIEDIPTWISGYRPTKFRMTWIGVVTIGSFVMQDGAGGVLTFGGNIVSLQEFDLTFAAADGFKITMGGPDGIFYITDMEFLE